MKGTMWKSFEVRRLPDRPGKKADAIDLRITPADDLPLGIELSDGVHEIVCDFLLDLVREDSVKKPKTKPKKAEAK